MKKYSLFTIIFFQIHFLSAQPDHWTTKATLTGHARMAGAAFSIGSKGFVGMGTDFGAAQSQLKDFWEYDPAADSYTQIADYPGGGVNGAGTFTLGDKGYVSCGAGNGNFYNDLWAYDTLLNTWTQKTSLPGSVRDYTVAFAVNGKGYIATGYSGSQDLNDLWEYDPVADSWTQRLGIGQARSSAAGFAIGNKGYIATGYVAGGTIDCWEFDPAVNSWTQKADVDTIPRSDGVGFSIGDYGYICCGYGINYPDNDLWEYDVSANTWVQRASLDGVGRANPLAFTIGLKGYVFGGSDPSFTALADMHEYTPDTVLINSLGAQLTNNDFGLYPNPAEQFVVVSSEFGVAPGTIKIYDLQGNEMPVCKSDATNTRRKVTVDVSHLPPGTYFLIVNGVKKNAKKLVIR